MTTVAISLVKNEADILPWTLRHMLTQVNHVIVADNMSTDATREDLDNLARAFPELLTVVDDLEPGYYQSAKTTMLARKAFAEHGAEWIMPFDADEFVYSPFGLIKDVLEEQSQNVHVAVSTLYNHVTSDGDDPEIKSPLRRIGWRSRQPAPLHKVACRYGEDLCILQGNHGATYDRRNVGVVDGLLVTRHFPYRSAQQFARKAIQGAKAYAATDLPQHEGAHWRDYGRLAESQGIEALYGVYRQWFHLTEIDESQFVWDPAHQHARYKS